MPWRSALLLLGWMLPLAGQMPAWVAAGPAAVTVPSLDGVGYAGPVAAVAVAPNGVVFAAGLGGVWANNAGSWTQLTSAAPVSALTLAGSILYAGTGDIDDGPYGHAGTGVLASGNAGSTWSTLGGEALTGLAIARIAVDPNNASHLFVAAMLAPDSPAGAEPGLYVSSDGGANWQLELAGEVCDLAWSGDNVLAVLTSGLELSPDSGAAFAPVPLGAVVPAGRGVAVVNPAGGFLVLWRGSAPALLSVGISGSPQAELALPAGLFSSGRSGLALAASGSTIWVAGAGVWESGNLGQSWTSLTAGAAVGAEQHAILAAAGGIVWLGGDSGLWELANGTWISFNAGLGNLAPLSLVVTASGGDAALDGDGFAAGGLASPSDWTSNPGDSFVLLAADPADASGQSLYAVSRASAQVWHTTNAGAQWQTAGTVPGLSGVLTAMASSDAGVWIGSSSGQLWTSSNGVATWAALSAPGVSAAITALTSTGTQLWLAADASLWYSGDGGQSWTALPDPGGTVTALAVDPISGAVVAATAAGPELLPIASNAWMALPAGLTAAPVTSLAVDSNENLWTATLGAGVWTLPLSESELTGVTLTIAPATATATAGGSLGFQAQLGSSTGPIPDAAVSFAASAGTNSVWSSPPVNTNAAGTAAVTFPVPTAAGSDTLLASASGAWGVASATAAITVLPASPAELEVVSGGEQSLTAGSVVTVVLRVTDQYGNPVPQVMIDLSAGAGNFSAASLATGNNGEVSVSYTLPITPGNETLTATAGAAAGTTAALTVIWTETGLAPPGYTLTLPTPPAPVAPNQTLATFTVLITPVSGYSTAVTLSCAPAPNCVVPSAAINAPYPPVTVTVDIGAYTANQTSTVVTVSADQNHQLTVTIPLEGFSLTSAITSVTLYAGGGAVSFPLAVAAINGFAGPVSFQAALSGGGALPNGLELAFSPASVPLGTDPASATMTMSALGEAVAPRLPWPRRWWPPAVAVLFWGWAWGWVWCRRAAWILAGIGLMTLAAVGCGSSPAADPPATSSSDYILELTASAAGLQVSVPISLTIIVQ